MCFKHNMKSETKQHCMWLTDKCLLIAITVYTVRVVITVSMVILLSDILHYRIIFDYVYLLL
jgi:hypothetical protein